MGDRVVATPAARRAMARERQKDLYGASLQSLVRGLAEDYGISQARLARVLGVSPAMLSQLVSGERIKIGDPVASARLMVLDQRRALVRGLEVRRAEEILDEVARIREPWPRGGRTGSTAIDDLREIADAEQLEAAAVKLDDDFPRLAEFLRRAAHDRSA
ncbi:helix-turn-helix domain-containing protein [Pseudonocardia sp. MH-G8]|uniref:helix-turn-helix domain-containing protein n=1 Tax=Pseudonocardia sp. MH-G8 TaxID=1854588 RepID=UPI0018EA095C|nr:helix-turn-helix domain-containing protein [Pseudonocardia sp. MH-G8]